MSDFRSITSVDWRAALTPQRAELDPAQVGRIRVRCPDCESAVAIESVALQGLEGFGIFAICPKCEVGSPAKEWRNA